VGLCDAEGSVGRAYGAPETVGLATYVVDRDGRIVLSCVEADPPGGLQLGEAMAALRALRARATRP
jgi:peroxiredoxin